MSPATTYVTFSLASGEAATKDIIIPKYTQLSCSNQRKKVYYATTDEVYIKQGEKSVDVRVVQGSLVIINTVVKELKFSQSLLIRSAKVAKDSVVLFVDGVEWTEVPDVLVDEEYGTKFSVHENENDYSYIEFGYSWKEYLPANNAAPVVIQYLETEGQLGSVKANLITNIHTVIYSNGVDCSNELVVTNKEGSSGGSNRETISETKLKIPKFLATGYTMCTLKDYEAFTNMIPGVYKCAAVDWNISWNGIKRYYVSVPYKVDIYVIPSDTGVYECSSAFLDHIKAQLTPYLWNSIDLNIYTAKIRNLTVSTTVYTLESSVLHSQIKTDVQETLTNYFEKTKRSFGETFSVSSIENLIDNSNSLIRYNKILQDYTVKLEPIEFPRLTLITVDIVQEY